MIGGGGATDGDRGWWSCELLELDPVAVAHEGFGGAVGGEAVYVHGGAADHPVDVDEAVVCAEGGELFFGHFVAADEAGGVGLA